MYNISKFLRIFAGKHGCIERSVTFSRVFVISCIFLANMFLPINYSYGVGLADWGCTGVECIAEGTCSTLWDSTQALAHNDKQGSKEWCIGGHRKESDTCSDNVLKITSGNVHGTMGMIATEVDKHCAKFCPRQIGMTYNNSDKTTRVKITLTRLSTAIQCGGEHNNPELGCVWLCKDEYAHVNEDEYPLLDEKNYGKTSRGDFSENTYNVAYVPRELSGDEPERCAKEMTEFSFNSYRVDKCGNSPKNWKYDIKNVLMIQEWLSDGMGAYARAVAIMPYVGKDAEKFYTLIIPVIGSNPVLVCAKGYTPNAAGDNCVKKECEDKRVEPPETISNIKYKGTLKCLPYIESNKLVNWYEMRPDGNSMYCDTGYYGGVTYLKLKSDFSLYSKGDTCKECPAPGSDGGTGWFEDIGYADVIKWRDVGDKSTDENSCIVEQFQTDTNGVEFENIRYKVYKDGAGNEFIIPYEITGTSNTCGYAEQL